jgi:mono/diheme cytochrome c family protein/plastocyanin
MTEQQTPTGPDRSEWLVRAALILILVIFPAALLGYQFWLRPALTDMRTIDIVAAAPEAGGFQPEAIRIAVGETVRLRISVPDVTHGVAIGPGLGLDWGQIDPGEVKEVEVTFDRVGRYTLYCNIWCSPNHWRMRSTIEVYDPNKPELPPLNDSSDPVIESLTTRRIDIDAPHEAAAIPARRPSAAQGQEIVAELGEAMPPELRSQAWRRSHSPVEAWTMLIEAGLSEAEAWDAVAYLWLAEVDAARLLTAASLFAKNCAACHGESGDGRGPGAEALAAQNLGQHSDMHTAGKPAVFAEPGSMLGGTSEIYYAKLRRGGMGTGMPAFGPIFTPAETWLLVDYLWTFVFQPETQPVRQ